MAARELQQRLNRRGGAPTLPGAAGRHIALRPPSLYSSRFNRSMRRLLPLLLFLPLLLGAHGDGCDDTPTPFEGPTYDSAALAAEIVYPAEALERNIRGEVVAEFLVGADGAVRPAGWLATDPLLAHAAAAALSPLVVARAARLDGESVSSWMRLRIGFDRDENGIGRIRIDDTSASREIDRTTGEPMEFVIAETMPTYDPSELRSRTDYPARGRSEGGVEIVRMLVALDTRGRPASVVALDGAEPFTGAAANAIARTSFTPAMLNGQAIALPIIVPVIFIPPVLVDPHSALSLDGGGTFGVPSREPEEDYDEFIPSEIPPRYDPAELQRNIIRPDGVVVTPGTVHVRARIDKRGKVADVRIDKGITPTLDSAAVGAVRRTTFTPAIQNGEPVALWISIPVRIEQTK